MGESISIIGVLLAIIGIFKGKEIWDFLNNWINNKRDKEELRKENERLKLELEDTIKENKRLLKRKKQLENILSKLPPVK